MNSTSKKKKKSTEYCHLEGTHKDHQLQHLTLRRNIQKPNPSFKSTVQTPPEFQQAQCCDHCPREPVPVPSHPLVKNFFLTHNLTQLPWLLIPESQNGFELEGTLRIIQCQFPTSFFIERMTAMFSKDVICTDFFQCDPTDSPQVKFRPRRMLSVPTRLTQQAQGAVLISKHGCVQILLQLKR